MCHWKSKYWFMGLDVVCPLLELETQQRIFESFTPHHLFSLAMKQLLLEPVLIHKLIDHSALPVGKMLGTESEEVVPLNSME